MSSSINNPNAKIISSNTAAIKENLSYIKKFGLPTSIVQQIDPRLNLNNVYINNSTTTSDVKLNS